MATESLRKIPRLLAGIIAGILLACTDPVNISVSPAPVPDPIPDEACHTYLALGYTDQVSYYPQEEVTIFLQSSKMVDVCRLDIFDVNENVVFSISTPIAIQRISTNSPYANGFGFDPTVKFSIPAATPSGVYLIDNKIPFIVKTHAVVDFLIVYPSNTANAYSESGGKSLYTTTNRPVEVSFLRPIPLQGYCTPCLKWFSTLTDFSVGYLADSDLDRLSAIQNSNILIVVGHSEYWTREARLNFDTYVDQGGNALILSGNTMWWQVRYSEDRTKLICYRTLADPIDDPLLKTITWDDPLLQYPILASIGADFSHGGYGQKIDKGWDGFKITSPSSPLLEGLNLQQGDTIHLPTEEFDGAPVHHFDAEGTPVLDREMLNVDKIELIGFDRGVRATETFSTFFVMQRSPGSGVIINTCTTDWCSPNGMGGRSATQIKSITHTALVKLLSNQSLFSD